MPNPTRAEPARFPNFYELAVDSLTVETVWKYKSLLDGAVHVVGALSAANRIYYTSFQFKRMRLHLVGLEAAPPAWPSGSNRSWCSPAGRPRELRLLVAETVEAVEALLPRLDTTANRKRVWARTGSAEFKSRLLRVVPGRAVPRSFRISMQVHPHCWGPLSLTSARKTSPIEM